MPEITLVLDNIRSNYNVGSLLRSADGFGVFSVVTVGITPHRQQVDDTRLPHVIQRAEKEIHKTALDAERLLGQHFANTDDAIRYLAGAGLPIICLELTDSAESIESLTPPERFALVVGNEVEGVSQAFLNSAIVHARIPMRGNKESFNVSVAGAVALYELSKA